MHCRTGGLQSEGQASGGTAQAFFFETKRFKHEADHGDY